MADFVPPNFQYPDYLRSAALGQQMGIQQAMAPGALALQGQEVQSGQLNLAQLKQMMQMRQQAFQSYQETMGGLNQPATQPGVQPTQAGYTPGGPTGGVQNGPQGGVSQPTDPLTALSDPRRIAANAAYGQMNAMFTGKDMNEPITNALKLQDEARTNAIAKAKLSAEIPSPNNPMPMFKAFAQQTPEAAALALRNNPQLLAQWPAMAKKYGFDPFDKTKIPVAAALEYNQQGAPLGLSVDVPNQLRTIQRGNGESIQVDDRTGKVTAGAPAIATDKFIDKAGNVVEMSKAQGVSQGLTPYDPTLYGAQQISDKALEQAYQTSKATGDLTQSLAGRDPIAAAKVSSYIAKRAQEDGLTGVAMAAQKQAFVAQEGVIKDYTDPSGKAGGKLQAINTVTEHAQALYPLIDALKTGNAQIINKAKLAYQQQTGSPAPTNYQAMANIFAGEITTAVTQNGGDKDERERLVSPFSDYNSPEQLKEAISTAATAMAGKTHALAKGWDVGTNGTQGSFDKFLTPATKQFLGDKGSGAPITKTIGGKTYIQQNGKWYAQ